MTKESDQFELFKLARRDDPETSFEAAERVVPRLSVLRQRVLDVLLHAGPDGLTDYEIEHRLGNHGSTYRTRRAELVAMGKVEATGFTRRIQYSNRKVWRAK